MSLEQAIRRFEAEQDEAERVSLLAIVEDYLPDQAALTFLVGLMMDPDRPFDERLEATEILKAGDVQSSKESAAQGRRLAAFVSERSKAPDLDPDEELVTNHIAIGLRRLPLNASARTDLISALVDRATDQNLRFNIFDSLFDSRFPGDDILLHQLERDPELGSIASRYLREKI